MAADKNCLGETMKCPEGAAAQKLFLFIRVNVTLWGGAYCSDTGDLRKQRSWLDNKDHVHAQPHCPLSLTPSLNLNIRIQSRENMCITFTSGNHASQLNVRARGKVS